MVTVHGIKACDTMKKAFVWLDAHGVAYVFDDFKKTPPSREMVERWCDACGWDKVLNRAGTTFRKLPDAAKENLDRDKAVALMVAHPSAIKRPVLDHDGGVEIGFKPERYAVLFPV